MKRMRLILAIIFTLTVSVTLLPGSSWGKFFRSVHGINFQAENPERVQIQPVGWGKVFKGRANSSVWLHVAIPFSDDYLALGGVLPGGPKMDVDILVAVVLNFKTAGYTFVKKVHVWSGPRRIIKFDNLEESGDFTGNNVVGKLNNKYYTLLSKSGKPGRGGPLILTLNSNMKKEDRVITYGVNISVLVEFGPPKVVSGGTSIKPQITFYQAMILTDNFGVAK